MTFDLTSHIEAVVARMKDRPSEFSYDSYRWDFLHKSQSQELLTTEERQKLNEALVYARRAELGGRILQALLDDPEVPTRPIPSSVWGVTTQQNLVGQQQMTNQMTNQMAEQMRGQMASQAIYQGVPSDNMKNFLK
jgi:hypothetical protein